MKIREIEPQIAQKLDNLAKISLAELGFPIPSHYHLRISLRDANRRKKPSNASAENWSPESGHIEIWFEREPQVQNRKQQVVPLAANAKAETVGLPGGQPPAVRESSTPGTFVHPAEAELLKALDRAEATPGWSFVPLKKFRDEILAVAHTASIRTEVERESVLRSAIEKGFVLTRKVHNPKNPQFPVTTVRVNRLRPEVRAVLGQGEGPDLDFHPVEIRGEPLSATVLRERR